jgi:glutamine amidotransferase
VSECRPPVAILDYRMGNLRSVQKALQLVGANAWIATAPEHVQGADGLVLPGVGAFGDAMTNLRDLGFVPTIVGAVNAGLPLLGICVGLQVLFEVSSEMGEHRGLGLLGGRVVRFAPPLVVPHVGWNQLHVRRRHFLMESLQDGAHAYFTHSYYAEPADEKVIVATTDYGSHFASIVAEENICGVQFHPEKSWRVGLRMLGNFVQSLLSGKACGFSSG